MTDKKKKTRNLLIAILLFAVLVVLYAALTRGTGEGDMKQEEVQTDKAIELNSVNEQKIASFSFLDQGKTVRMVDNDGKWCMEEDPEFPVKQDVVESMLTELVSLQAQRKLVDQAELSEYGLLEPSNIISQTDTNGKETLFKIGGLNQGTGDYYVLKNEEKDVYTVSAAFAEAFQKSINDLADAGSFPTILEGSITHLSVEREDSLLDLSKAEGSFSSKWKLTDEAGMVYEADDTKVSELFKSASGLVYERCVDYNGGDLALYGLDQPRTIITVDYTEEQNTGSSDAEGNSDDPENTGKEKDSNDTGDMGKEKGSDNAENKEETESSDQSKESDSTDSDINLPVEKTKQAVLLIGTQTEDGAYYVKMSDSAAVHTISSEIGKKLTEADKEQYISDYVSYVPLSQLKQMTVIFEGAKYDITLENNSENKEKTDSAAKYIVNGVEADGGIFQDFYNKAFNMKAESSLTNEVPNSGGVGISIEFMLNDAAGSTRQVSYLPYDKSYYLAQTNDSNNLLVNKRDVNLLLDSFKALVNDVNK